MRPRTRKMEEKYKISVTTPNGVQLTYRIDNYEMLEGGLIRFIDKKYNKIKIFDSRLCEIEEIQNDSFR